MENELVVSEQSGPNDPFTLAEVSVASEVTPETTKSLGDNDIVPANNEPFNHATFEKIDFSPEYFKDLMKSFGGKKEIIAQSGERYTPTRAFAAQAAGEFDVRTGMGNYDELKNGTSKFMPGKRFSDREILKYLTTMEPKGYLDSLGTRMIENVPVSTAFVAGFAGGKKVAQMAPINIPRTGIPIVDKIAGKFQVPYVAGRFALPYITGIGSSIMAFPYNEYFGEMFLGDKKLPFPEDYATMRAGEMTADVLSYSPLTVLANRGASGVVQNYLMNRLNIPMASLAANPAELAAGKQIGKNFDLSNPLSNPFGPQYKAAQKVVGQRFKGSVKGAQGPLPTINDFAKEGVASIMQGNTAPVLLRKMVALEEALLRAGSDIKKNPALFAFYETLAAGGAAVFGGGAAKANPFSMSETVGEIGGAIGTPVIFGQLAMTVGSKLQPFIKTAYQNLSDYGFTEGVVSTFRDTGAAAKNARGFRMVLEQLQEFGSIDTPEKMQEMIRKLESLPLDPKIKATSGMLSEDPAIQSMEAALAREFDGLELAQQSARQLEIDLHEAVLTRLSIGGDTPIAKEALKIAAEIKETIFEKGIESRLNAAENQLFKAFDQLKKTDTATLNKMKGPDGKPLTAIEKKAFQDENMIDLSNRLVDMLMAQKALARSQQKTLYGKVGELDINAFFNEKGEATNTPRFIAALKELGPYNKESLVRSDLSKLFQFAERISGRLGLDSTALSLDRPALEAFNAARIDATGGTGINLFDRFLQQEILSGARAGNDGLPEVVTTPMIRAAVEAVSRRGDKNPTTKALYENLRKALIEKQTGQGGQATGQADNALIQTRLNSFDAEIAAKAAEEPDAGLLNDFVETFSRENPNASPTEKATVIRNWVTQNSMRPEGHSGLITANKLDYMAANPLQDVADDASQAAGFNPNGISLRELTNAKSDALAMARNGNLSPDSRRVAGQFAAAIEDDLVNFADKAGSKGTAKQLAALTTANAFTKAFSDVYYRSYVGKALKQTQDGGFRMAPESIALDFNRTSSLLADPNYLKVMDIQQVGRFAQEQGIVGAQGGINSIQGVIDKILRTARAQSYDPETKTINQKALNDWIKSNSQLEAMFPELFADLKQFDIAKEQLGSVVEANSALAMQIKSQTNFASLLRNAKGEVRENPTAAVAEAMGAGKDQLSALDRLFDAIPKVGKTKNQRIFTLTDPQSGYTATFFNKKEAEKALKAMPVNTKMSQTDLTVDRQKAIDGFKSSLFEYFVLGNPAGRGQNIKPMDPIQIYKDLFEKKHLASAGTVARPRTGRTYTTMAEYMLKKGVFTESDIKYTKQALESLIKVRVNVAYDTLDTNFAEAKPIIDFGVSIFGSAMGTRSQSLLTGGTGGPGSIIAAGKGAEAARNIFLRLPQSQRKLFAADLLQNPKLLASMLRQYGDNPEVNKGITGTIADYLKSAGYVVLPRRFFSAEDQDTEQRSTEEQFNPGMPVPRADPVAVPTEEVEKTELNPVITEILKKASYSPPSRRDLPPPARMAAPRGVQTASVDPSVVAAQRPQSIASSGGISSIDPERAKLAFGPFDILTARNGGEIRLGIGGLFR